MKNKTIKNAYEECLGTNFGLIMASMTLLLSFKFQLIEYYHLVIGIFGILLSQMFIILINIKKCEDSNCTNPESEEGQ